MKRPLTLLVGLGLILGAVGCSGGASTTGGSTGAAAPLTATSSTTAVADSTEADSESVVSSYAEALTLTYDKNDLDASWNESAVSFITLVDGSVRFDGIGATATGNKVTITQTGTYVVSGSADEAQILVDCKEVGLVRLVLKGASFTCADGPPIYVKKAEKVILVLADGTQNSLTDGDSYALEEGSDEPNAAVFSRSDLTINGGGSLTVKANYNDGITSKDVLKIVSGTLTIDAANDAIKGKDCLGVKSPTITVTAKGDGLQSTNDSSADKGFICISGGTIDITAGSDGVQAKTTLLVTDGMLSIRTGGGSTNAEPHTGDFGNAGGMPGGGRTWGVASSTTTTPAGDGSDSADTGDEALIETENESSSSKGLKAGGGVFVEGGTFDLDCSDDTIHSNAGIKISGGTFTLASGDDAIHADESITINGGDLTISTCYEGIESNVITLNAGNINVVSSDDAINGVSLASSGSATSSTATNTAAAGGGTGRAVGGGMPGESGNAQLFINGGYIMVDARGDGIDINGNVEMTAGTVIVNGPTENMNGALDYLSQFKVTGGYLVAVGSSGMAEAPSQDSTQYAIMVNFDQTQAAGTLVHVEDEDGNSVLTFAPTKQFQSVVLCSADLRQGATYDVFLGGTATGSATGGLYSDGTYSGGTQYASLTLTSIVTVSGAAGMMGGNGGRGIAPAGGTVPGDAAPPS